MLAYRKALQHAGLSAEQAGLSTDRQACLPTGRPVYRQAGLSTDRQA
jgi:hypothetical protein